MLFFFFLENIPKWVFLSNLDNFPSLFPSLLYLITFYQFLIYSMFLRLTFESCQLAFMCLWTFLHNLDATSFAYLFTNVEFTLPFIRLWCPFLTGVLPAESSSMDIILVICKSSEFPNEKFLADISRVLKPGGTVLLYLSSQSPSLQVVLSSLLVLLLQNCL